MDTGLEEQPIVVSGFLLIAPPNAHSERHHHLVVGPVLAYLRVGVAGAVRDGALERVEAEMHAVQRMLALQIVEVVRETRPDAQLKLVEENGMLEPGSPALEEVVPVYDPSWWGRDIPLGEDLRAVRKAGAVAVTNAGSSSSSGPRGTPSWSGSREATDVLLRSD